MGIEDRVRNQTSSRIGFLGRLGAVALTACVSFGSIDSALAQDNSNTSQNQGQQRAKEWKGLKEQGDEHHNNQRYSQAIQSFTVALAVPGYEHNTQTLNNRGGSYLELLKWDEATVDFEHAIKYEPINPTYRTNLSSAQYSKARRSKPKNPELALESFHNDYIAMELAYAQQLPSLQLCQKNLDFAVKDAKKEFPMMDTSEATRGMTRNERYGFAQILVSSNKPAALHLFRKVLSEKADDKFGISAARMVNGLQGYLQKKRIPEVAMRK